MLLSEQISALTDRLASLYEAEFGGKARGRYRISRKVLGRLAGRRRVYPEAILALQRDLFERGFVLIELDNFFVVLSTKTFDAYRRVGPSMVDAPEHADSNADESEHGSEDE